MTTTLNLQILDEIGSRLQNITTDNGYFNTIAKIERARLKPFNGYDLPAVNYWPTNLGNDVDKYNKDNRTLFLIVEAHTKTRDLPFTDVCDELASDVVTGLNRSTAAPLLSDPASLDLGELVEDFKFLGYDYQIGQGQDPFCGIVANFSITFTTDVSNTIV